MKYFGKIMTNGDRRDDNDISNWALDILLMAFS